MHLGLSRVERVHSPRLQQELHRPHQVRRQGRQGSQEVNGPVCDHRECFELEPLSERTESFGVLEYAGVYQALQRHLCQRLGPRQRNRHGSQRIRLQAQTRVHI